jgi:multidrug efflux pump
VILGISVGMIYLALAVQFRSAVKPWIVFGAIPYGMVGAVAALWVVGAPFGFMAFLGIVSLVGVIVSHVIVLCYAQIGGLAAATVITLLLVPVFYSIAVRDL